MNKLTLFFFACLAAAAQPVVAPTDAPVGSTRGQNIGEYNILQSFELGYRFHSVGGNVGRYRSDVNFGNGIRLLGSSLSVNSREGHGSWFDELLINTQGLGNDPYESATARIVKNRLYRYDLMWRLNEYYNPALPIANGFHAINTVHTLQDHSLVLLPESPFRILAGYSRTNQNGPALSTVNGDGDEFPLFTDVRRLQDEVRVGAEIHMTGLNLSIVRSWEGFRDDTRRTSGPNPGLDPNDTIALDGFRRDEPYHGSGSSWRTALTWDRSPHVAVNGRFNSVIARRDFIFDEATFGASRFTSPVNRQILVFGDARRPLTSGSLTITLFPKWRLNIVNHTAFHNTRMEGDANYSELDNSTLSLALTHFNQLGIRTITNSTDANLALTERVGLLAGYQFSARRVRTVRQPEFNGIPERTEGEQENTLHTGRAGIRLQPIRPLRILLDGEIGRADNPIYPISGRNYHAIGGRVQYKIGNLFLRAAVRTNVNFNSVSLFSHSSRSRQYSADASWTLSRHLALDASWSKLHLDTVTGIAYFFNSELTNDRSVYISNIHSGTLGLRIAAGPRAELYLGYARVQDVGDGGGQRGAAPGIVPGTIGPGQLGFQVLPLTFESPLARLSIKLHNKLRWNAGYQYYRYGEELLPTLNYRAHTGFTSLSWSF
jgi:hypothetical protein